jgi:hypothetical protein
MHGIAARRSHLCRSAACSRIFAGESFMLAPESGFGSGSFRRRSEAAEDGEEEK